MRYLTIAILLTICVLLSAVNELEVVWQQHGEQANDNFGMSVISLDFNGDNIDDLAVNAWRYTNNPELTNQRGKIYIYMGSEEGLPTEPDIQITTVVDTSLNWNFSWITLENIGDMNGDNCDEIGFLERDRIPDGAGSYIYNDHVSILLGSTVMDTISDYTYESESSYSDIDIRPLGDINGDGYDDAGVTEYDYPGWLTYSIIYGGSFEKVVFVDSIYTRNGRGFCGLGDVNNDGYDDFSYYYEGDPIQNPDETWTFYHYNRFFWGGAIQDTIPDSSLDYQTPINGWYDIVPAGDWDGDGYADFAYTYYDVNEEFYALGCRLWRGGETIDWNRFTYISSFNGLFPDVGDINGDQKLDIVDTNPTEYGGFLYFYIGNQNGTKDYNDFDGHYGYGSCAVGDFDNDGYDDIAVGAYGESSTYPSNWGDVYVYGGHAGLIEQDLDPVDNETVPPADITFNAFPNPFNPEISFEIKTDKKYNDLKIEIYNIKGQRVETIAVVHPVLCIQVPILSGMSSSHPQIGLISVNLILREAMSKSISHRILSTAQKQVHTLVCEQLILFRTTEFHNLATTSSGDFL